MLVWERERASNQAVALPGYGAQDAEGCSEHRTFKASGSGSAGGARVISRAHPLSSDLCVGEEPGLIEGLVPFEHEVDCAAQLVGENAECLALTVFLLETGMQGLGLGEMAEDRDGRLTEGPLEMDVSDLGSGGAGALAGRAGLALHEAGIGGEALDGLKAADVVDLIEKGEGQDLAHTGNGGQAKQAVGIMDFGLAANGVLQVPNESVVGLTEGQVGLNALSDDGIGEGTGQRGSVAPVGQDLLRPRQIVLVEGVLDVGEELATLPDKVGSASKEIPGGPHGCRIGVGLGEQTSPEEAGGLVSIDAVVLGLGSMDGLHVQGMAEDEGDGVFGTEVGEPVPVEDALGGDDEILPVGLDGLEEASAVTGKVLVEQDVAFGVLNAQIEGTSVEVDAAVVLMLSRIEAHGSPPGSDELFALSSCLPTTG